MVHSRSRIALAALAFGLVVGAPGAALAQTADGREHHGEHGGGQRGNPPPAPAPAPAAARPAAAPAPAPAPRDNHGGGAPGWNGGNRGWQGGGMAGAPAQPGGQRPEWNHGDPHNGGGQGWSGERGWAGDRGQQPRPGWNGGDARPETHPDAHGAVQPGWAGNRQPGAGWQGGDRRPDEHGGVRPGWAGDRGGPQPGWAANHGNPGWHGGAPGHAGVYDGRPHGDYRAWSPQFREQWRGNPRYDWRGWRDAHRDAFHIGRYYAPYRGAYYSRLSIGFVLEPAFYGDSYMIYDPWSYHLPPAWAPYRWVRYYDDAVLVDTYTGQVVDVLYDFFW